MVQDLEIYITEDYTRKFYLNPLTGITYESGDIIHLADLGNDELRGKSRISQHKATFGKAKASAKMANELYSSGMFMGGTIEYPENVKLTTDKISQLTDYLQENYGGADRAGSVLPLDQGGKYNQFTNIMSLADAEYIMGEHLSIEDICRIFGVPPFKVFHFNKMTYDNMEAMKVDFVESCIMPIVTQFEQEVNYKLFTEREIRKGYQVKHNIKSLLRADVKAQAEYYKAMFSIGKYTINELRSMDDMPSVEGGDSVFVQVNNYMPLGMVEDYSKALIASKSPMKPPTDDNKGNSDDDDSNK